VELVYNPVTDLQYVELPHPAHVHDTVGISPEPVKNLLVLKDGVGCDS
jgi:hypothetical protein